MVCLSLLELSLSGVILGWRALLITLVPVDSWAMRALLRYRYEFGYGGLYFLTVFANDLAYALK